MEELLEAVSDAVSAMVLYSVEAEEKNARVPDILPGATVVKSATDILVDLAMKSAEFWVKFNQPNMRDRMLEEGGLIKQATSDIVEAANILHQDGYSKPGKKLLLKGAKSIMEHMVILLQLADLYEVTRICRGCNRVSSKRELLFSLDVGESYFITAAQEMVTSTVDLAKMIIKRIKEIDDYALKRRFEDASTKMRAEGDGFIQSMGRVMKGDPSGRADAQTYGSALEGTLQEIIIVAKLSAKSPFDLSMIEGLDLRDDEDLKDMAQIIANQIRDFHRAVASGDVQEAQRLLNAIRNGLENALALNKALAKNCDDPIRAQKYEQAALAAQAALNELLPSMNSALDDLLNKKDSGAALRALRALMPGLLDAVNSMANAGNKPSADEIEALLAALERPLAALVESVQRGDVQMTAQKLDEIKQNVAQQLNLARAIAKNLEDPVLRARMEEAIRVAEANINQSMAQLGDSSRSAAIDPASSRLQAALRQAIAGLTTACGDLVKKTSVADAEQSLAAHRAIGDEIGKLQQAVATGNKKDALKANHAIRNHLNNELAIARAIARNTDDVAERERLEALLADAQQRINDVTGELGSLAERCINDPGNQALLSQLNDQCNEAQALSAKLVGAASKDLLVDSNSMLNERLQQAEKAVLARDNRGAAEAMKAVLAETAKQAEIARMIANGEPDPARAMRINELADDLANTQPALVAALKGALGDPNNEQALNAYLKTANDVKFVSSQLVNAATMNLDDELLANGTLIDGEMERMLAELHTGKAPTVQQVSDLIKKVNAQAKLAALASKKGGDKKRQESLLKAGDQLSKLMGLMVAACKDAMANPNDAAAREKLAKILRDVQAANRDISMDVSSASDAMAGASEDLSNMLDSLKESASYGTDPEVQRDLRKVEAGRAKQVFYAHTLASATDDPERKAQIEASVKEFDKLFEGLPAAVAAVRTKRDPRAAEKLANLIDQIKASSQKVAATSSSAPGERLAARARLIGSEMDNLDRAVLANDAPGANNSVAALTAALKQQIQLAKTAATNLPDRERRAVLESVDRMEKSLPALQATVKEALANKTAHPKLTQLLNQISTDQALVVAGISSGSPEDNLASQASLLKGDIDRMNNAIKSNNPQELKTASAALNPNVVRQQVEILKAHADRIDDPTKRQAVLAAINALEKNARDLAPVVKAIQANPSDRPTIQKATPLLNATSASLDDVLAAANSSPVDKLISQASRAAQELQRVDGAVKRKSEPDTNASLLSLKPALLETARAARAAAENVRDQGQKRALFEAADKIDQAHEQVASAARYAVSRPNDADAQRKFEAAVEAARQSIDAAVANAAGSNPEAQTSKIALRVAGELDVLNAALEAGDSKGAARSLANLQGPLLPQIRFAKASAALIADTDARSTAVAGLDKVIRVSPTLISTAEAAAKNPQDKAAVQKYQPPHNEAKNALAEVLQAASGKLDQQIINNGVRLDKELDNLFAAAKANDTPKARVHLESALLIGSEQSVLGRALANSSKAENTKQLILRDVEALEKAQKQLALAAKEALEKPGDKTLQDKLSAAVNAVKAANKSVVGHAQAEKTRKEEEIKEKKRLEKERIEREEKERKQREEDEVAAAAAKLAQRIEQLKIDNSAEGKLYKIAQSIAIEMEKLSKAAKAGDKRGMIEASRALAVASQQYIVQARVAAESCTDPKLVEQIITSAQAAKNFAVQLKIIAAVKAADDDNDSVSAKQQLVKCAKGLCSAVVSTVNYVEIAAIRTKK